MSKIESFLVLQEELKNYRKVLKSASEIIRDEDVSRYPIFVIHQQEITIGIPVIEKDKTGGKWNINASTLEEFVTKSLVYQDKTEEFIDHFKDADEFACLFVLSELGANFIYLPYS